MSALTETFTGIADAIREKTGTSSTFTPAQMITEIENIPTANWIYPNEYRESTITSYTGSENLILDNAFMNCSNLSEVSFPECEYIDNYAFYSCINLSKAIFPECSYIGLNVFVSCTSLSNISFPSCTYIGEQAFADCTSLSNISFPNVSYIEDYAFWYCSNLSEAIFPECKEVGTGAFYKCINLSKAIFPECSYIADNAFCYCSNLSLMYLLSTSIVSLTNINAFDGSPLRAYGTGTIYVPSSLYNNYITARNWSTIKARISSYNG